MATTGAGVTGNILLHQSIEKKSGGGGGSGGKIGQDGRTDEQKDCDTIVAALNLLGTCEAVHEAIPGYSVEYCEACK